MSALRILERESKPAARERLPHPGAAPESEAIDKLRSDLHRAFTRIEEMGAIREVLPRESAKTVAQAYAEAWSPRDGPDHQRSVLAVCATHEEIGRVTKAIREDRRLAGQLGHREMVTRHVPLNWTEAQRRDPRNYEAGVWCSSSIERSKALGRTRRRRSFARTASE